MNILVIFAVTLSVFLLVVSGMAVGVIMGRRAISGSCGGLANQRDGDGNNSCSLCSDPDAACRELGQRMQTSTTASGCDGTAAALNPDRESAGSSCEKDCVAEGCSKEKMDACKDH